MVSNGFSKFIKKVEGVSKPLPPPVDSSSPTTWGAPREHQWGVEVVVQNGHTTYHFPSYSTATVGWE